MEILGVLLILGGVVLAFNCLGWFIAGAVSLFTLAAESAGFVGIALYVILWVIASPIMVIASIIVGFFVWLGDVQKSNNGTTEKQDIPTDAQEKYKWANRLPPYDK